MYKVVIVEDDSMVCAILERQLAKFNHLELSGSFKRGADALDFLQQNPDGADLIILDYYMPGITGIEFLTKLRANNKEIQIIMITSADEYEVIRDAICCGICDYVLKPFSNSRLEKAIGKFETVMKLKRETHVWTQDKVDVLLCPHKHYIIDSSNSDTRGNKINPATLKNIRDYMNKHKGEKMSLVQASSGMDLSTVTIRRYLKYLNTLGEVEISLDCKTGGRPSELFEYVGAEK